MAWTDSSGKSWKNSTDSAYFKYACIHIQVLEYSISHHWPMEFKRLQPSDNVRKPQALVSHVQVIFVAIGYTN